MKTRKPLSWALLLPGAFMVLTVEASAQQGCPSIRETAQNPSSVATKDSSCSTNNGKLFEGSDGHHLYMQCCTDPEIGEVLYGAKANNFGACMDLCVEDTTGQCRAVNYDPANSRADGINCILLDGGKFSSTATTSDIGHYAFLVDPPTADHPDDQIKLCSTECPYSNNQLFTSKHGETFRMVCGKRHGVPAIVEVAESYEQCLEACGLVVQCKSVDYHRRTKKCYMGDHGGEPLVDASGFDSAYSMGPAGACCGYPKSFLSPPQALTG